MPVPSILRLCRSSVIPRHLRSRNLPRASISPRHHASSNPNPQRDAQLDRQKMNTDANEYAKSGTDDVTAQNEEAAFDPNITDPEEAKKKAGEGNEVNPLDASPANPKLSQGTSEVDKSKEKES